MGKTALFATLIACTACCVAEASEPPVVTISINDIASGEVTLPGSGAVATGQPNAEALRIAAEAGFVAVIDLRGSDEDRGLDEQAEVQTLGMTYLALPVVGAGAVNFENAAELDRLLADLDGPVLLHCGSGNRVGALFALREKLHGATDEDALAKGRAAGLTNPELEAVVIERLADRKP